MKRIDRENVGRARVSIYEHTARCAEGFTRYRFETCVFRDGTTIAGKPRVFWMGENQRNGQERRTHGNQA